MSDFPELTIPLFTPVDSTLDNIYLCHCADCVFFHSFQSPAWRGLFINTAALRWVLLSAFGMLRGALPNGIGQVTRGWSCPPRWPARRIACSNWHARSPPSPNRANSI